MENGADGSPLSFGTASTLLISLARIIEEAPTAQQVLAFAEAARGLGDDAPGCKRMKGYFADAQGRADDRVFQELAVDWTLAFRGVNPSAGPRPPYAGAWLAADAVGVDVMMAVNTRYVEHGLGAGGGKLNRMDYLGVELEFVAILLQRCDDAETADERSALEAEVAGFADAYILSWLSRYRADVEAKCTTEFWKGFLELLEAVVRDVRDQCERDRQN